MRLPTRGMNQQQQRRARQRELFKKKLSTARQQHPDASWLPYPNQDHLHINTLRNYATQINQGRLLGAGYEARVRQSVLYVREQR